MPNSLIAFYFNFNKDNYFNNQIEVNFGRFCSTNIKSKNYFFKPVNNKKKVFIHFSLQQFYRI